MDRAALASDARAEGCTAAQDGLPIESNPHTPGSLQHTSFNQGWLVAHAIGWTPETIRARLVVDNERILRSAS